MNKKAYVGVYAVSFLLALLAIIALSVFSLMLSQEHPAMKVISSLAVVGLIQFFIVSSVYPFILVAKMWGAIQDGQARTTPGKAVGFLFIPFFNIYWFFQVWAGFPTDYNRFVERYKLPVPHLAPEIYVAYSVLFLLSMIPFLGILAVVAILIITPIVAATTCDAVNRLAVNGKLRFS